MRPRINTKKRTCHLVDSTIPADHRMKIKETKKVELAISRELKKQWNMKDTNCSWNGFHRPEKETGETGNHKKNPHNLPCQQTMITLIIFGKALSHSSD